MALATGGVSAPLPRAVEWPWLSPQAATKDLARWSVAGLTSHPLARPAPCSPVFGPARLRTGLRRPYFGTACLETGRLRRPPLQPDLRIGPSPDGAAPPVLRNGTSSVVAARCPFFGTARLRTRQPTGFSRSPVFGPARLEARLRRSPFPLLQPGLRTGSSSDEAARPDLRIGSSSDEAADAWHRPRASVSHAAGRGETSRAVRATPFCLPFLIVYCLARVEIYARPGRPEHGAVVLLARPACPIHLRIPVPGMSNPRQPRSGPM